MTAPATLASSPLPLSPDVSEAAGGEYLAPKTASLGSSLTALVSKKIRGAESGSRAVTRRGKSRRSSAPAPGPTAASSSTPQTTDVPRGDGGDAADGGAARGVVGNEAGASIPDETAKDAPDIDDSKAQE